MPKLLKKPSFDANKSYKWNPEDVFEISGAQFASLYHALTQQMNVPGGAPLSLMVEAYGVIMSTLSANVESGIIEEADIDPKFNEGEVKQLFPERKKV